MHRNQKLLLVLPAYNEEMNILRAIEEFRDTGYFDEILVIDNNSRDRTVEYATHAGARVIREPAQGYGAALQRGMREATGDSIILAEPDGTFIAKDIVKLLVAYADEADLVLGTRTTPELIWAGANMGFFLRIGNEVVA